MKIITGPPRDHMLTEIEAAGQRILRHRRHRRFAERLGEAFATAAGLGVLAYLFRVIG